MHAAVKQMLSWNLTMRRFTLAHQLLALDPLGRTSISTRARLFPDLINQDNVILIISPNRIPG